MGETHVRCDENEGARQNTERIPTVQHQLEECVSFFVLLYANDFPIGEIYFQ